MNHKIRFFTLLIAASLLLAACTIKLNTTVNSDGSGERITEFGLHEEDELELADFDIKIEEFC